MPGLVGLGAAPRRPAGRRAPPGARAGADARAARPRSAPSSSSMTMYGAPPSVVPTSKTGARCARRGCAPPRLASRWKRAIASVVAAVARVQQLDGHALAELGVRRLDHHAHAAAADDARDQVLPSEDVPGRDADLCGLLRRHGPGDAITSPARPAVFLGCLGEPSGVGLAVRLAVSLRAWSAGRERRAASGRAVQPCVVGGGSPSGGRASSRLVPGGTEVDLQCGGIDVGRDLDALLARRRTGCVACGGWSSRGCPSAS